ncbi:tape measure protein [Viscerimonas tarda]
MAKPVEIEFLFRDKTREGIEAVSKNVDNLSKDYKELIEQMRESNAEMERAKNLAKGAGSQYKDLSQDVNSSSMSLQSMLLKLGGTTALLGLGKQIINVRGEIQMMEKSFEVLTGSEERAVSTLAELKDIAVKSPLTLTDITNGAQMLMAFNVEAEKSVDVVKQMSDISMGDSQKFQSLLLAYSQMSSLGKVISNDMRQMATAGFNPLVEISRTTGRSIKDLSQDLNDGAITVDMVKEAFVSATSEGGKFYKMTEKQAEGIVGLKASLSDAWMNALNKIGESNEGLIVGGYKLASSVVENYEKIGKILVSLVATYGAYRAAVVVTSVAENLRYQATLAQMAGMTKMQAVTDVLRAKTAALNATIMKNPYAAAAALIVALVATVWTLHDSTTAEEKAQKKLNDTLEEARTKKQNLKTKSNELIGIIKDETQTIYAQVKAYEDLKKVMPYSLKGMTFEQVKALTPDEFAKMANKATENTDFNAVNKNYTNALNRVEELKKSLNKAMNTPSDDGNWGAISGLETRLKNAEVEAEKFKTKLDELKKIREEAEAQAKKQDAAPIKNKEYWEQQKKTAESARAALDTQEKNGDTWIALTKKIADAQKEIDKYNDGKTLKNEKAEESAAAKAEREAQQQAEASVKLINADAKAALERRKLALENDQKLLDIEKDSFDKRQNQIELEYQKELLNIDNHARELIEKQQEAEKLQWEKDGKKGVFTPATNSVTDLPREQKNELIRQEATLNKVRQANEKKLYDDLLDKYRDFNAQRAEINRQYNEEHKFLMTLPDDEKRAAALLELDRKRLKSIKEVNNEQAEETKKSSDLFIRLFLDASQQTVKEIRTVIDEVQQLYDYLQGKAGATIPIGFTPEELERFKGNAEQLKALLDGLNAKADSLKKRNPFQAFDLGLDSAIKKMKSGKLAEGIEEIGRAVQEFMPSVNEFGQGLATIFGSSDAGDKVGRITSAVEGLGQTAGGVGKIMAGDVIGGAMDAVQGIAKVVKAMDGLFGSNVDKYNKAKKEYEDYTSVLDDVIGKQRELVQSLDAENAANASDYALSLISKAEAAARTLGKQRLNAGASAGSHSYGRRQSDRMGNAEWNEASSALGGNARDIIGTGRMTGLFDLSAEQLEKLKTEAPLFWSKLDGDAKGYLEDIIAANKSIEEMKEILNESLTGISFDSLYDEFLDTLMNMDASAEDMAGNFEKYLQKAIINSMLSEKYKERLRAWYEDFATANKDGLISAQEKSDLEDQYKAIIDGALAERDSLKGLFDWQGEAEKTKQQGKAGAFTTITQDQGTKLEGLLTSFQMHEANIDDTAEDISLMMFSVLDTLSRIEENTSYCRKLEDISQFMAEIKRDGLKVK